MFNGAVYRIDIANMSNLVLITTALCNDFEHLRLTDLRLRCGDAN